MRDLQKLLDLLTKEEMDVEKELDDNEAGMRQLETAMKERRSTFFVGEFPFLGKRLLEMPILDAFNSPLKIDNLWSEGLTHKYGSFSKVTVASAMLR